MILLGFVRVPNIKIKLKERNRFNSLRGLSRSTEEKGIIVQPFLLCPLSHRQGGKNCGWINGIMKEKKKKKRYEREKEATKQKQ